jgi:hypothetical protein
LRGRGPVVALAALGLVVCVLAAPPAAAQSRKTEHTLTLDDPAVRPPARIEQMSWLAGSWLGEALGGTVEEVWTPPSAGTMVGMFKLMHDGKPSMYELELIVEEAGSLTLKVKHFDADFGAWEEKQESVGFPLVRLNEKGAWFDGLTILRDGADGLTLYLAMKHDGKTTEQTLVYRRAGTGEGTERRP